MLKKHPPPLFCHRGRRVTNQQTPLQRTGSPFLRFGLTFSDRAGSLDIRTKQS